MRDNLRSAIACIIGLSIAAIMLLASCSSINRIEKIHTPEANNLTESYLETVWNPDNNQPDERASARKEIRAYLNSHK